MAFGLGVLRLSPTAFWQTTLRELAAAMRGVFPDVPDDFNKAALDALMRRYPDA